MEILSTLPREYQFAFTLFGRGLAAVGLVWGIAAIFRWRRDGAATALGCSVPEAIAAVGLVAIWAFTVAPLVTYLPGQYVTHLPVNLVPVLPLVQGLMTPGGWHENAPNLLANALLYVPLGVGMRWRFRLSLGRVIAIAACLSAGVEVWQAISDQMRAADINDVLLNTAGAGVGAWAFSAVLRATTRQRRGVVAPG